MTIATSGATVHLHRIRGSHLLTPYGIRNLAVIFDRPTVEERLRAASIRTEVYRSPRDWVSYRASSFSVQNE